VRLFVLLFCVAVLAQNNFCWTCQTLWRCTGANATQCRPLYLATRNNIAAASSWKEQNHNDRFFNILAQYNATTPSGVWEADFKFIPDFVLNECDIFAGTTEVSGTCSNNEGETTIINPILTQLGQYKCALFRHMGCSNNGNGKFFVVDA